jgi:hypothetical protein
MTGHHDYHPDTRAPADKLAHRRHRTSCLPGRFSSAPSLEALEATKTPMSSGRSSRVIRVTAREAEEGRMCNVLDGLSI